MTGSLPKKSRPAPVSMKSAFDGDNELLMRILEDGNVELAYYCVKLHPNNNVQYIDNIDTLKLEAEKELDKENEVERKLESLSQKPSQNSWNKVNAPNGMCPDCSCGISLFLFNQILKNKPQAISE